MAKTVSKSSSGSTSRAVQKPQADSENTLYLIDISSFIFRAFYAIRVLTNRKGEPTNAVYGVATMVAKLVEQAKPKYLAVVYDSKEPSFRKEIFEEYKANRSVPPDDLVPQFDRIEQLIRLLGIHSFRQPGVEADDLIAAITRRWVKGQKDRQVVILSGDKDLMQLVNGRICLWDTMKDRVFHTPEVVEKFGVKPDQIRDYLAIVGDSSDNIPGVPSIGPKGAAQLLNEYGQLDSVLSAAEAGKIKGKRGEVLKIHKKRALLSADLATLREDLPLEWKEKDFEYQFQVRPDFLAFLKELDFHTLVEKWRPELEALDSADKNQRGPRKIEVKPSKEFQTLTDEKSLQHFLEKASQKGEICFDLETTSLNPRQADIVGYALSADTETGYYVPVRHREGKQLTPERTLEILRPVLENPRIKKIGQNLKYDWSVLYQLGVRPDGIGADTMIADYLLDPSSRHNLDTLAARILDYQMLKYEDVCGKGKDQITFDNVPLDLATRYAAEDAVVTFRLWEKMKPLLEKEGLTEVFARVEIPLIPVLVDMECEGVALDSGWLSGLSSKFSKELKGIEERIQSHVSAKDGEPLNLNSTRQLQKLLFEDLGLPPQGKTKTGFSTDARVLEALSPLHEVPRLLMEYREISKLKSTYVEPLPELVDPKTGRIHGSFHQTVAATGRLSSSEPNLQNIPIRTARGQMIRKAFVPSQGCALLSCDYSQIELRILASMSGDPVLLDAFQKGEDVHRRTAGELFKVNPSDVSDSQRGIAKAINFGLMYGKTVFGLSQELKIPRAEAKAIIDRYFKRYGAVKSFLDGLIAEAKAKEMTVTLMGRKRKLPELRSKNPAMRGVGERMAMNTPIQGTAADLIKLAMIDLSHSLKEGGFRSRMIIQVHDELVLDCPKDEIEEVKKLVVDKMENAIQFKVPLKVNASVGANWQELK